MKFEPPLLPGVLMRRYKRFLADVEVAGQGVVTMHCANTGAMLGCDTPGSRVWFSTSPRPQRKYAHTLEIVETAAGNRICVNTARANAIVAEALIARRIPELVAERIRREVRIPEPSAGEREGSPLANKKASAGEREGSPLANKKASAGEREGSPLGRKEPSAASLVAGAPRRRLIHGRFDFGLYGADTDQEPGTYVEVKSVTLARGCLGAFPDAVSERARRHVEALGRCVAMGYRGVLLYCVPHTGIRSVTPADDIDPQYGSALRRAADVGVEVIAYGCTVSPREIALGGSLGVVL